MMWRPPVFVFMLLLAGLAAGAAIPDAAAQRRVETNTVFTTELAVDGTAEIEIHLQRPAQLGFDLFSGPDTLASVGLQQLGEDGVEASEPSSLLVLGAGRHRLGLVGSGPQGQVGGTIQGRVRAVPPSDAFEPNETPQTARAVDLPFHRIVRLAHGDWDWFRIDPPRSGVLGIQLHGWRGAYSGPAIRVVDANGAQLYQSPGDPGGWNGMRYVEVGNRPVMVGVTDTSPWQDRQADGYKALEIVLVEPIGRARGQLVTLGLGDGDTAWQQLNEIGTALGIELREANEAEAVSSELSRVVEGTPQWRMPLWQIVLLLALAGGLAGGGCWAWWRARRNAKPES